MNKKDIQRVLKKAGLYNAAIDGKFGRKTNSAINMLISGYLGSLSSRANHGVAAVQVVFKNSSMNCAVDGFYGPNTEACYEDYMGVKSWRDDDQDIDNDDAAENSDFKLSRLPRYGGIKGVFGSPGQFITTIKAPYKMVLAWDTSKRVKNITVHSKVADRFEGMLNEWANELGQEKIEELGLHLFGGSFNIRKMRGGSKYSTHSWAVAMDFDPTRNRLRSKRANARLGQKDAEPVWKIVDKFGLIGLGPAKNYDWMHIQAVRV